MSSWWKSYLKNGGYPLCVAALASPLVILIKWIGTSGIMTFIVVVVGFLTMGKQS